MKTKIVPLRGSSYVRYRHLVMLLSKLGHLVANFRWEDRIKQHVPSNIRNKTHPQREQPPRSCKSKITTKTCDSAIGQHLLENPDCAKNYNCDMFRIIGKARSSFYLAVLESIYISTKKPLLCRQKEFVFTLGLHW